MGKEIVDDAESTGFNVTIDASKAKYSQCLNSEVIFSCCELRPEHKESCRCNLFIADVIDYGYLVLPPPTDKHFWRRWWPEKRPGADNLSEPYRSLNSPIYGSSDELARSLHVEGTIETLRNDILVDRAFHLDDARYKSSEASGTGFSEIAKRTRSEAREDRVWLHEGCNRGARYGFTIDLSCIVIISLFSAEMVNFGVNGTIPHFINTGCGGSTRTGSGFAPSLTDHRQ